MIGVYFQQAERRACVHKRTFQHSGDPGNCGSNSDRALITGTPSRSGRTSTKNLAALNWTAGGRAGGRADGQTPIGRKRDKKKN